jgi:hypothetical protein
VDIRSLGDTSILARHRRKARRGQTVAREHREIYAADCSYWNTLYQRNGTGPDLVFRAIRKPPRSRNISQTPIRSKSRYSSPNLYFNPPGRHRPLRRHRSPAIRVSKRLLCQLAVSGCSKTSPYLPTFPGNIPWPTTRYSVFNGIDLQPAVGVGPGRLAFPRRALYRRWCQTYPGTILWRWRPPLL